MPLLETTFFIFLGTVLGVLVHWLWWRGSAVAAIALKAEKESLSAQLEALNSQMAQQQAARAAAEERASRVPALETELRAFGTLREENARLLTTVDAERRQADEKLKLLLEAKEALTEQFRNLANKIFEEKGEKLVQQNAANLGTLLNPLSERLKDFQGKVEETYDKESKQRFSLQAEIQKLIEANTKISEDANNLANALKGSSKTQGSWGELVLERVLEASGLHKGREYEAQVNLKREDGTSGQPDVVVRLPENKHVVVDSKVSLVAYEAYCAADDEVLRKQELKKHIESLRAHIDGLAAKNYPALYGIRTPDFVLMFIPIEPAFILAASEKHELFVEAMKKNVMIVSPTTLLISLRTIASIWRYEYQNRNAQELVRQCTALYDKFVNFVGDLEDVGKKLDAAQKSHEDAYGKLRSGRGNLIRQTERIRELGLKPAKLLPAHLTDAALEEEGESEAEVRPLPTPKASAPQG
jgi:DNA recombination protein RmuC